MVTTQERRARPGPVMGILGCRFRVDAIVASRKKMLAELDTWPPLAENKAAIAAPASRSLDGKGTSAAINRHPSQRDEREHSPQTPPHKDSSQPTFHE